MVAAPHAVASSTGLDLLRSGGSAVDAAIGINAVLTVAYPHMAGLGGDGVWLIAPPEGDVRAINASGPAAAAADRSFYTDSGRTAIPERGPAAALTVPGAVDGWRLAHEEHGRLPWDRLFEDAVALARGGLPLTENLARWIRRGQSVLTEDPQAAATFLSEGCPPTAGQRLLQPELAESLSTLSTNGPREGFYEGDLADAFCAGLGSASPLRPADFERYRAE